MTILISFIIGVVISTICFKLGFAITRSYVDIKLIFIVSVIGAIVGIFFMSHRITGFVITFVLEASLFKKFGGIKLCPDFIIAFIVAEGILMLAATFLITSLV
jgi:hypothetical protein